MTHDPTQTLLSQVAQQIDRYDMIAPGDAVLVALSGGPDSMALLHALLRLRQAGSLGPCTLCLAHLNHTLRAEQSDQDEAFVREQAAQLDLPLTVERIDVAQAARDAGCSLETEARQQRYAFLERAARRLACTKIAFAHHADDNVETILHHILRGTGLKGLAGIPAVRPLNDLHIVRPLLATTRQDILAFLQQYNIPCRHDLSNLATEHTRNRLRHELLPLLREKYNPQVDQALLRLGHVAGLWSSLLAQDSAAVLDEITLERTAQSLTLSLAALNDRSPLEQAALLQQAIESLGIGLGGIGFEQITRILDMAAGSAGHTTQLPGGLTVSRQNDRFTLQVNDDTDDLDAPAAIAAVTLAVPGVTPLPAGLVLPIQPTPEPLARITVEHLTPEKSPLELLNRDKPATQECLDADCIQLPLVVRTWEPNDRFGPLGAPGHKTLGDFLTDCQVPAALRRRLALLCDAQGILWVVGLRIAERVKVTDGTRSVYRITAE